MSIATDLASIHILATVYKNKEKKADFLKKTVTSLTQKVDYIDWAEIFFIKGEECLLAVSNSKPGVKKEDLQSKLVFPITKGRKKLGYLVVKSRQWIVFDVTDVSTLEKVANELGQHLY
ncbi:GAF domain-containing protein [Aliibacillus thermotolerans]|uniref:GAF domain-containing protein n=1 Tax=Aliibacillus thermotolerans TaxID=1834418 RepID=A0ABW0U417_9BACI|nr:GAF domain-containing protein [Aliibacillus thermotolerans]MDA3129885.1 GAF domain-containing protein [Aliibacillus thermotolerans]